MASDADVERFRALAEEQGLLLRTPDEEEPRFVFELKAGTIVTSPHPGIARQLLLLAEAVYGPDRGEARELSKLVARRDTVADEDEVTAAFWRSADKAYAMAPDAYRLAEWVSFADWIDDQFLLEDAIARMDEGVPV